MTNYNLRNSTPRPVSEDERGELYDFVGCVFDVPRSDAQAIVDAWTITVYDKCTGIIPYYSDMVLIALAGGKPNKVYIFTWVKGSPCLAREYNEVPGTNGD